MSITASASQRWVLALTSTASLMVALDQLVVATALSTIRRDLHASTAALEWTVNAYSLSFALLLITGAVLGDRFGRRRMFVAGLAGFVASSAGCALADSTGWLILARSMQGAASALVMPMAMALLTAAFPPQRRGAALGIFAALTGVAVVGGPLAGGAITQSIAWQWIFWVNVPIGLVAIPLVLRKIGESRGLPTAPDPIGLLAAGSGMFGLTWGLVRGNTAGWTSAEVLGALGGGLLITAGFVGWELKTGAPMLPMGLFRRRAFSAGNGSAFLLYAGLLSSVFLLAQYLQVSLGYGPFAAGLRFLPWTAVLFVIAPLAGRLADRVPAWRLVFSGLMLQGAGMAWVAVNAANDRSYAASILALLVSGTGTSTAMPAVQSAIMNSVPATAVGTASGTFNAFRQLGSVFGIAACVAVFSANGSYASAHAYADGFAPALALSAALALAGSLVGLATGRAHRAVRMPAEVEVDVVAAA